eukprot:NODE_153_length_15389_cov_1.201439.p5 type:complete len:324 gc:universal NODE_153_length_15389_cov_1.201439:8078-7107(-)
MRHGKGFAKLSRDAEHRRALLRNLATQLFLRDRIVTTTAKAKELRKFAEPLITKAKIGTPRSYELAKADVFLPSIVLPQLFGVLGQRYKNRAGGYCRLLRLGLNKRSEDETLIELVDSPREFAGYYRSQSLDAYREQLKRIQNLNAKESERPFSHVYPGFHRSNYLEQNPDCPYNEKIQLKLKEIIKQHDAKKESSLIEYYSDVTLTQSGPVYDGEKVDVPDCPLQDHDLKKTKVIFNELNTFESSGKVQKKLRYIHRKALKLCKDPSKPDLLKKVKEKLKEKYDYKGYSVAIKSFQKVELIPKSEARKSLSSKKLNRNKHLR